MVIYFRKEIWGRSSQHLDAVPVDTPDLRGAAPAGWAGYVIVGTIPIVVLGLLFEDSIDNCLPRPAPDRARH